MSINSTKLGKSAGKKSSHGLTSRNSSSAHTIIQHCITKDNFKYAIALFSGHLKIYRCTLATHGNYKQHLKGSCIKVPFRNLYYTTFLCRNGIFPCEILLSLCSSLSTLQLVRNYEKRACIPDQGSKQSYVKSSRPPNE